MILIFGVIKMKNKKLALFILSFLAILSPISALEPNFWGKNVKTPLEVYFRDCTSSSSCPTVLGNSNGIGNLNSTAVNINTSFNVVLGSNFGVQTIFKPEQSLVKDMLYNLSVYSCTSSGSSSSATLQLLNVRTGSTYQEVQNYSNSINVISSSSSVISDRPFISYNLSDATASSTNFESCSMYNVLFVPSKNSNYIGVHNKSSVRNSANLTFVGYNLENLGQYNQLSSDQIQQIVSNNNEVIKNQIDQMNNDISSSLDDLRDQNEKNWQDNLQNCRDSKNLFNSALIPNVTANGVTWSVQSDGAIKMTGSNTSTGNASNNVGSWSSTTPIINLDPSKTYTLSFSGNYDVDKVHFEIRGLKDGQLTYLTKSKFVNATITGFSAVTLMNFYALKDVTNLNETIYFMLQEGSTASQFEQYGKRICSNKIDDVKDTLTDDNIGDSDNKLGDFLTGFQDKDPSGISGIVTVPLRIIKSFSTSQCKPFELDFYGDNKVSVPCVSSMISDKTKNSSQFKLFQTIMTGLVAYRCVKSLYSLVQRIKNPDDDRVEVLDL